jgi:hypothetical protein
MTATSSLERQLSKAEAVVHERQQRRWEEACDAVMRDLTPEQCGIVGAWSHSADPDGERCPGPHGDIGFCTACIRDVRPPALVRALWALVMWHLRDGTPVAMPAAVAQVYVEDPDAWPLDRCERCRYLLPMRATLRADGTFLVLAQYDGACPSCGLDTRQRKEIDG